MKGIVFKRKFGDTFIPVCICRSYRIEHGLKMYRKHGMKSKPNDVISHKLVLDLMKIQKLIYEESVDNGSRSVFSLLVIPTLFAGHMHYQWAYTSDSFDNSLAA